MTNRRITARKRHVLEMRNAPKARKVGDHRLATPDRPILAVAGAIQSNANYRPLMPVLGHARRKVSMMMLNGDCAYTKPRGKLSRCRVGMEVVGRQAGF